MAAANAADPRGPLPGCSVVVLASTSPALVSVLVVLGALVFVFVFVGACVFAVVIVHALACVFLTVYVVDVVILILILK